MLARVPASSANLGPGFDVLAVALGLYLEVQVEPAEGFSVTSAGCGAGQFDDERNLGAVVAAQVLGHWDFHLRVNSDIPLSRGLGSSAALALAAAAAAGSTDPLAVATAIDGHAENAAASLLGGLVVAGDDGRGGVVARSLALDEAWRFVLVIPERELSTAQARAVLPASVPFADAVGNVNALGLLIAGLAEHHHFVSRSMQDHLHQPYRAPLLPFAADLLATLRDAGAAGACWSGAGSTMLGLALEDTAREVSGAARAFLEGRSIPGDVVVLEADRVGLVVR